MWDKVHIRTVSENGGGRVDDTRASERLDSGFFWLLQIPQTDKVVSRLSTKQLSNDELTPSRRRLQTNQSQL